MQDTVSAGGPGSHGMSLGSVNVACGAKPARLTGCSAREPCRCSVSKSIKSVKEAHSMVDAVVFVEEVARRWAACEVSVRIGVASADMCTGSLGEERSASAIDCGVRLV